MLIAWSGHRPEVFRDPGAAEGVVRRLASERVRPGVEFICGGQRGVDQWAGQAAVEAGIPSHVVLPIASSSFSRDWAAGDRRALAGLLSRASLEVIDSTGDLGPLAYDLRNETVVRRADGLVVVWTGIRRGGTFETLCAAKERGMTVEVFALPGPATWSSGPGERGL